MVSLNTYTDTKRDKVRQRNGERERRRMTDTVRDRQRETATKRGAERERHSHSCQKEGTRVNMRVCWLQTGLKIGTLLNRLSHVFALEHKPLTPDL